MRNAILLLTSLFIILPGSGAFGQVDDLFDKVMPGLDGGHSSLGNELLFPTFILEHIFNYTIVTNYWEWRGNG